MSEHATELVLITPAEQDLDLLRLQANLERSLREEFGVPRSQAASLAARLEQRLRRAEK